MANTSELADLSWSPDHEFIWGTIFGAAGTEIVGDRDLLKAVVAFANDHSVADELLRAGRRHDIESKNGKRKRKPATESEIDAAIARDRADAQDLLRTAVEDFPALFNRVKTFVGSYGWFSVVRRPAFGMTSTGKVGIVWRLDSDDVPLTAGRRFDHALAYAAALLVSDEYESRSKLRCCKLESCGRFFYFEREPGKGGRPRDSYCSTEHASIAHQKDSARRHREAKRKRIEAAEARKKQRRRHK